MKVKESAQRYKTQKKIYTYSDYLEMPASVLKNSGLLLPKDR